MSNRTNKLPRTYPGFFSLSFRVPWSSFTQSPPFPRPRWSVPSTPRRDSARLTLVWSGPASGQRPSDQRTLFLRVPFVHNACVWIVLRARVCVILRLRVRAYVQRCVYRVRGLDLGQASRCRRARLFLHLPAASNTERWSRLKKSSVAARSTVAIVEDLWIRSRLVRSTLSTSTSYSAKLN